MTGIILYSIGRSGRRLFPQIAETDLTRNNYNSKMSMFLKRIKIPHLIDFAKRYRFGRFVFACWTGQSLKAIAISYLGYLGLGSFLRW